ncbi:MAG: transposase [Nitrospirae bacterium]|nr:MAG: transposase [Nitrospirota bacterium]
MYLVRKRKLGRSETLDLFALESGRVYTMAKVWFWRIVRRKGIWLSEGTLQRLLANGQPTLLHSQSAQKSIQCFFEALRTWRRARTRNPDLRPPRKRKKFSKIIWKDQAIKVREGRLVLPNTRGTAPVIIDDWLSAKPVQVELGWDGKQYELRASYKTEPRETSQGFVASVDLGEVHSAVMGTDDVHVILNGRLLRSKRRYRERLKAKLSAKIDRKQKGGKRREKLITSKRRQLKKLDNQIRDIEHKLTTAGIKALHEAGVRKLVFGDLRDVRVGYDKGRGQNQRMHQAPLGRIRSYLVYKGLRLGWQESDFQDEAYSGKDCPRCGQHNNPKGRNYSCASCGFKAHRDVVGQVNILHKYRGVRSSHVIGAMASPIGIRWTPHLRCSSKLVGADHAVSLSRIPRL